MGLCVEERPDIICQVFMNKLDELVKDLTKGHFLEKQTQLYFNYISIYSIPPN